MQEWNLKRFNMDLRNLEKFVIQGEDSKIDFKSAFNSVSDSFYETVVSFQAEKILLFLVPSWNQKGTNLKMLIWPEKQIFSKDDIEKVSSWFEKCIKLLQKKVRYIITILFLCAEPISLEDLMIALNYKNRKTFRENYLNLLEQVQLIEKTNPGKPSDPEQKYRTTEEGKLFLNGK